MQKDDFIYLINQVDMDALLFLKDVKTREDLLYYETQGYVVGYTSEEWQKKYPLIDYTRICFVKNNPAMGTVYFDEDKYIFFELHLYGKDELCISSGDFQSEMLSVIKKLEDKYKNKDWLSLLHPMKDSVKLYFLNRLITNEESSADIYELFIDVYQNSEYGFKMLNKESIEKVMSSKSEEQKQATLEALEIFKDEITVYRGFTDLSNIVDNSYSWTYDINIANFFACRRGTGKCYIAKGTVKKEDILECLMSMHECEFIISPEKVKNVEVERLVDFDNLNFEHIDLYRKNAKKIKKLYGDADNEAHDASHSARVLYLALAIAQNYDLNDKELRILCDCAVYHDIGRDNDSIDRRHGAKSYEIFAGKEKQNSAIEFIMTYHCIDDNKALMHMSSFVDENIPIDRLQLLFNIFKDADGLDRVRFDIRDLDLNMLRCDISKKLTPVAVFLQKVKMF